MGLRKIAPSLSLVAKEIEGLTARCCIALAEDETSIYHLKNIFTLIYLIFKEQNPLRALSANIVP